jgi:hypothetical protein
MKIARVGLNAVFALALLATLAMGPRAAGASCAGSTTTTTAPATCANGGIACGSGCGGNINCVCIGTEISGCQVEHAGSTNQPVCVTGPPGGTCFNDTACPANTVCVANNPCAPATCIGQGHCQSVCPE